IGIGSAHARGRPPTRSHSSKSSTQRLRKNFMDILLLYRNPTKESRFLDLGGISKACIPPQEVLRCCALHIPQLDNRGFSYQKTRFVPAHLDEATRLEWRYHTWPTVLRKARQRKAIVR